MTLQLKRVYDKATSDDGFRVLVDRLWPRGVSKERARIDLWAKDAAPSPDLRKRWHAAPAEEWDSFADAYRAELGNESAPAVANLASLVRTQPRVTFVYASHDPERNHARVLMDAVAAIQGPE